MVALSCSLAGREPIVSLIRPTAHATAGTRRADVADTEMPDDVGIAPNKESASLSVSETDLVSSGAAFGVIPRARVSFSNFIVGSNIGQQC